MYAAPAPRSKKRMLNGMAINYLSKKAHPSNRVVLHTPFTVSALIAANGLFEEIRERAGTCLPVLYYL